jgi:hypothetical protein
VAGFFVELGEVEQLVPGRLLEVALLAGPGRVARGRQFWVQARHYIIHNIDPYIPIIGS